MNSKQILQPIMDLFTGADGGIAYIRLREAIDEAIKNVEMSASIPHPDLVKLIDVSILCSKILKMKTN